MTKLYKAAVWLDADTFMVVIFEGTFRETDKFYVSDGKRIAKDKIMKVETGFVESHKTIRHHIYFMDGDKDKAVGMIMEYVLNKIERHRKEIDAVEAMFKTGKITYKSVNYDE
jgi:hypothetical protein